MIIPTKHKHKHKHKQEKGKGKEEDRSLFWEKERKKAYEAILIILNLYRNEIAKSRIGVLK